MNRVFTKIFTHKDMPYIELRYSNNKKHYKNHLHDTFSIGINVRGDSIYTNKTKKYSFRKGMLAIVNPNEIHSCNPIDESPNLYYMLYLDKNWCFELQRCINNSIQEFIPFDKNLIIDNELYEDFKTLCENLFSNISFQEKENELICFLTALFEDSFESEIIADNNVILQELLDYFRLNYQDNLSLNELATTFNLNPFYIIRLFKSRLNITPHTYLLNLKINQAKELLKKGFPIVDVALECGFSDQSHFHRNFTKIVATTPKEYRLNFIQD